MPETSVIEPIAAEIVLDASPDEDVSVEGPVAVLPEGAHATKSAQTSQTNPTQTFMPAP
ncbi:MAG: hypothetical protein AABY01_01675 [Nanoarchaeota archaeon]